MEEKNNQDPLKDKETEIEETDTVLKDNNGNPGESGSDSEENKESVSLPDTDNNDDDEYEKVCSLCLRPESKAGKLISVPGGFNICPDCMQNAMNTLQNNKFLFNENTVHLSSEEMEKLLNNPNIRMFTAEDLAGEQVSNKNKVKKRKKKEEKQKKAEISIKDIPAPHIIKEKLDEYVVGQEHAKKVMSVAVYNHYKRIIAEQDGDKDIEIEKSNMLMIGPTGSGKTYMVKTMAELLDVPLAITDATSLTEAGYIGDDIESVVSKLLAAADNDVEKAETGIIFIDEIDKIARKDSERSRDVSGESVQQGMLKLLEGSEIEVPVGATSKNAMVPLATVNTRNILFICGGAFPDLENIIKERLTRQSTLGFQGTLKDKYDNDDDILKQVEMDDLRKFGMIPEFLGRLPIVFAMDSLSEDLLVKILTDPKNAIIKQYKKLLAMDEVELNFTDDALRVIAKKAIEKKTGARALRAIIEEFMLDIMYEIPKDQNIGTVTITADYIKGKGVPLIQMRGVEKHQRIEGD